MFRPTFRFLNLASPVAAVLLAACFTKSGNCDFKAGFAKTIITPDPLLPVSGGMGPTAPANEKRGELTVRAMVLESKRSGNVTRVAIMQVDALGFPSVLSDRVRKQVTDIPAENILIGATHTHSAPDFYAFPDGKGGHTGNLAYIDSVCTKAAATINDAIRKLQPAKLRIATGKANGKIAYNYYAPALYDPRVSVIQAISDDDQPIATLVNYAVHPEVLGAGVGILSPDLIGPLCDRIESKAGGGAMFMNGAQGGMVTADNRNLDDLRDPARAVWNDDRVWSECVRIGHLLADESLRILSNANTQADPSLVCRSKMVRFPVESDEVWAVVRYSPLKYPHNADRTISTRINAINIGNSQILTIPGEALPNVGFYLKRKMQGQNNMLFGLTNDAFGYIMTKVDFNSFERYEYISRVSLGENTGEILIQESLDLVDELPRPKTN
ncbi:MAG: hypothetical protein KDB27_10710 [Planctomycetales bacterium]|nr:hypothetical protein [Planctomycetales bacterium]